ncbi:rod shape-determining protein RodA [Nocardioidaceae bacterium]|nr:rod shape-determining protein RodA [Nocardioidaceae bacterium]
MRQPRTRVGPRVGGVDVVLLLATAALLVLGTLLVWSATGDDGEAYLQRHLVNIAVGLVLGTVVVATDYRWLKILTPLVYLGSVVGLLLVLVMGSTINGSRSWLLIGGLSLQPAEFAKLAVVVTMALLVAERTGLRSARTRALRSRDVVVLLGVAAVPALLILGQPDLGTVLVLTATVFGTLAVAGASRRWMLMLVGGGIAAAVVAVQLGVLKAYQVNRFLAYTDTSLDPRGAGYNVVQARIAIGNGGVFGQGLGQGSQTHAGFVPEQHTDFIFTVAGEELGLIGAGAIIALVGIVVWRALVIASRATDLFGRVAAGGIACWIAFQGFQNIGMCLGIMPVTGVPLPLVSHGGSALFATLAAIGVLQNIALRSAEAGDRYGAGLGRSSAGAVGLLVPTR